MAITQPKKPPKRENFTKIDPLALTDYQVVDLGKECDQK
jgi:hypothetical protein